MPRLASEQTCHGSLLLKSDMVSRELESQRPGAGPLLGEKKQETHNGLMPRSRKMRKARQGRGKASKITKRVLILEDYHGKTCKFRGWLASSSTSMQTPSTPHGHLQLPGPQGIASHLDRVGLWLSQSCHQCYLSTARVLNNLAASGAITFAPS